MPCNDAGYPFDSMHSANYAYICISRGLCEACRILKENNIEMPKPLDDWHTLHQLTDYQRDRIAEIRKAFNNAVGIRRTGFYNALSLQNQLLDAAWIQELNATHDLYKLRP